jgi:hypothetical protein
MVSACGSHFHSCCRLMMIWLAVALDHHRRWNTIPNIKSKFFVIKSSSIFIHFFSGGGGRVGSVVFFWWPFDILLDRRTNRNHWPREVLSLSVPCPQWRYIADSLDICTLQHSREYCNNKRKYQTKKKWGEKARETSIALNIGRNLVNLVKKKEKGKRDSTRSLAPIGAVFPPGVHIYMTHTHTQV